MIVKPDNGTGEVGSGKMVDLTGVHYPKGEKTVRLWQPNLVLPYKLKDIFRDRIRGHDPESNLRPAKTLFLSRFEENTKHFGSSGRHCHVSLGWRL
jgi:hypothetical protein